MAALRLTSEGDMSGFAQVRQQVRDLVAKSHKTRRSLGTDYFNRVFNLANGGQVYVSLTRNATNVHLIMPTSVSTTQSYSSYSSTGKLQTGIPDLISGVARASKLVEVTRTRIDPVTGEETEYPTDTLEGFFPTEKTLERFTLEQARDGVAVEQHDLFRFGWDEVEFKRAQTFTVRPGFYTGYMRTLVQLCLGIGIIKDETYEQRQLEAGAVDPLFYDPDPKAKNEFSSYGLYSRDRPEIKKNVLYDYRFHKTHGLAWAEGVCFIIEIGIGGVYATPLQLDPVSVEEKGREQYLALYPELGEPWGEDHPSAFELFGGFPAAEDYPLGHDLRQKYVKAGEMVQALTNEEMMDFYSCSYYTSAWGWAFNQSGTRADNTCYLWPVGGLCMEGRHYRVQWTLTLISEEGDEEQNKIKRKMQERLLVGLWKTKQILPFEKRKLGRLSEEQVEELIEFYSGLSANGPLTSEQEEELLAFFHEIEVAPFFTFTASLTLLKASPLFYPAKLTPDRCFLDSDHPQIKVGDPLLPNCPVRSLNFFPGSIESNQLGRPYPSCDIPIMVYYKGDSLSALMYSYQDIAFAPLVVWDTREACQYEGQWLHGINSALSAPGGYVCSNEWDPRSPYLAAGYHASRTTGEHVSDLFHLEFCHYLSGNATIRTAVYHSYLNEWQSVGSCFHSTYAVAPFGDRSVYALAYMATETEHTEGRSFDSPFFSGHGPETAYGHIYDFVFHWVGGCRHPDGERIPASCRYVEYHRTTGESCFPGAPSPPEIDYRVNSMGHDPTCERGNHVYYELFFLTFPYAASPGESISWDERTEPGGKAKWEARIYGDTPIAGAVLKRDEQEGQYPDESGDRMRPVDKYDINMDVWWRLPSPTKCNEWANWSHLQNYWGNPLVNYNVQFQTEGKSYGGPPEMYADPQTSCYVGYVV